MKKSKRTVVGFLVAPLTPAALLYFYGLIKAYGTAAIVGPLLLLPVAYLAALVIGIPVYRLLNRKNIGRLSSYLLSGTLIGASAGLLLNLPAILSGQTLPLGDVYVATMYAAMSAAAFWGIAVRGAKQ